MPLIFFVFFSFSIKRKKQRSSESGDFEDLSFIYHSDRQPKTDLRDLKIEAEVKAIYNLYQRELRDVQTDRMSYTVSLRVNTQCQ